MEGLVTRLFIFMLISVPEAGQGQQLLLGATPKPAPISLQTLTDDQRKEVKELGAKALEAQISQIRSKVDLELLSSTRPSPSKYFDSLGPAKRSVEDVTDVEGLYGKAVCPQLGKSSRILIVQDAPMTTLLHEYIHILQIQNEKRWCELDGRVLDSDQKKEKALLYHRFEFEALKSIWDIKGHIFMGFEDRAILVEGLSRENQILKTVGVQALDEEAALQIDEELRELHSKISLLTWLSHSSEDAGSVLQKMEILTLKSCVEQTPGDDEVGKINECVKHRCAISGFACQSISLGEMKDIGADLYAKVIHAWVKPNTDPQCPTSKLKDELVRNLEDPTPCWRSWYMDRSKKRKAVDLEKTDFQKLRKAWNAAHLTIDAKISFFQVKNPASFINKAYCYFIFQKIARFDSLPIDQFAYATQGASFSTDRLGEYGHWLDNASEGKTCAKLVKLFSGNEPSKLTTFSNKKKYILILNPLAALAAGTKEFQTTMSIDLNHERLHLLYAEDGKIREKVRKSWDALGANDQEEFKKAHPSYDFRDKDVLLKEYFSYKFQSDPKKLF